MVGFFLPSKGFLKKKQPLSVPESGRRSRRPKRRQTPRQKPRVESALASFGLRLSEKGHMAMNSNGWWTLVSAESRCPPFRVLITHHSRMEVYSHGFRTEPFGFSGTARVPQPQLI